MKKLSQFILFFFLAASSAFGQVQYQLDWLPANESYRVSMVVGETWEAPYNMVSTAQVTLKIPTGGFEIANVNNLIPDVSFVPNSRYDAPSESSEFDYISFGLETLGTDKMPFTAGTTIPLFTFQNVGNCDGIVRIMNNDDEFMPPNTAKANVGNSMTVLGAGGDAYVGNTSEGVDCDFVGTISIDNVATAFNVFPNPVENKINIEFTWPRPTADMNINVYDIRGKQVMTNAFLFTNGDNTVSMDVDKLPSGLYSLEIQGTDLKMAIEKFMKL